MSEKNTAFTIEELTAVLDSIKDAIFIDDKNGITLWCNKTCEALYNIKKEDVIGISAGELEKQGVFTPSVTVRVLEQQEEVSLIHENKIGKHLLSTGIPIFSEDGTITQIITTSRDITEINHLQKELERVQRKLNTLNAPQKYGDEEIVAASQAMYNVLLLAKRLADVDSTVLITGESGVGKGLIARYLHKNGPRKDKPMVTVNCGAIPENLIESELFGYERGAFTGSRVEGKVGLFEEAEGGTIFLDEISELPLNLQVKLLQVIQEREFKKVGGVKGIPVDVRIISATNQELRNLVEEGAFREDLYYRLNVVPINVPPLRERTEDILPLIHSALYKLNEKIGEDKIISSEALAILLTYQWPGNAREVENIIERLVITTKDGVVMPENLPPYLLEASHQNKNQRVGKTLQENLDITEKEILVEAMKNYSTTRAMAKALGVSQPTVVRKIAKHKL
ncbi:MAG: sigma 54-interacting transcriptional regulator [Anaerovoracaceae bacterium]|jgi:transcriptional regulator with PAS, ATPase and Fis domain|nr:sigma 54-interacting transcriptional regulator [Anaerovoracaceae bacterium]